MENENQTMNETLEEENPEIVELTDESGKILHFYHIGTLEYEDKPYAFFQPAEEVEGVDPEEVVIFEVSSEGELLPIESQELLDNVFNAFCEALEDGECCCDDEECHCHDHECDCNDEGEECHCHEDGCNCHDEH